MSDEDAAADPDPEQPFDAGDRGHVKKRKRRSQILEDERLAFVAAAMGTPQGRAYFWGLLGSCHVFASSWSPDPSATAFREGERNIGLAVLANIQAVAADQYVVMVKEAKENDA